MHLFGLAGFAISQPLFDLLARHADFLVAHDVQPPDVLALTFVLGVLVPAVPALAVVFCCLASPRLGRAFFTAFFAILVVLTVLPVLKKTQTPGAVVVPAAAVLAAAVTLAYARLPHLRTFMTFLAPATLVFAAAFLLSPPIEKLMTREPVGLASHAAATNGTSPVIVVVFDEFPVMSLMDEKLEIDGERYPAFAALAHDATWFRDCTAVATSTTWAVPAILTGRYPDRWRQATAQDYPRNLFTALGDAYDQYSFEPITQLCPPELCENPLVRRDRGERLSAVFSDVYLIYLHIILPPDLGADLPDVTGSWKDFAGGPGGGAPTRPGAAPPTHAELRDNLNDAELIFSSFLETLGSSHRPSLHFLHLNVPHLPWKYLPSGKEYGAFNARFRPPGARKGGTEDEWLVIQGYQRHLLQVGFADRLVGRLVETLKERGLYDQALLVVTSDHGVTFHPGRDRRGVDALTAPDIMFVPFFLKLPHQDQGAIDERNVESVDILPTILAALGIDRLPWPVDGRSVLDVAAPERTQKTLKEGPVTLQVPTLPALAAGRRATVERKLALFGSGAELDRLYRIGPYPELLGRWPADLLAPAGAGPEVVFDQAWQYDDVDLSERFVPANVTGRIRLEPGVESPLTLAVAVNGVIRATTRTFDPQAGWASFEAMVPETAFATGANDVEVLVAVKGARGPRLIPTRGRSGRRYALARSAAGEVVGLTAWNGRSIPLVPGALQGSFRDQGMRIAGWAADLERARDRCQIVVFVDGRFAYEIGTGSPLPESSRFATIPELAGVGFRFTSPSSLLDATGTKTIRVFAIQGGVATELESEADPSPYLRFRGERGGPPRLLTPSGRVMDFDQEAVLGHVTRLVVEGSRLRLSGWAIDAANADVPETVVAVVGHRWVASARTGRERPAVERKYGDPRYRRSGFEIELPLGAVAGGGRLGFVAVSQHGTAATLELLKQPRSQLERLGASGG